LSNIVPTDASPESTPDASTPLHANEDFERHFRFIQEFNTESDRAVVILGAAKIDQLLCELLTATLLPVTGSKDELLDSDGPLATFSARIGLCHRLGLIDAEFTRSLQQIRRIRNAFAHEVSGCSLTVGAQADRVRELAKHLRSRPIYETVRKVSAKDHAGLSAEFRAVVAMLISHLDWHALRASRLSLEPIGLPT
jgi:DNA-binding MltR family transcriptional regulator